ncbi:conjugal transfer protein MobB [Chryseobacterium sp.]|uniref:conjugal transfer protein MobB n=1 Tax=Chryseobacterium sp. TaxID=1871047 RepID=UPI003340C101
MIAKIGHGSKMYGALRYNHIKVLQNKGEILYLHNMFESSDGNYTTGQLLSSFLPYLAANKKTEKTTLHISLNPDPNDRVSDQEYIRIAREYMDKMGYGEQPYVIFKHNDIDRTHIHIVSTSVDKNGNKIPDSFEKRRSMEICRTLEKKYGLIPANEKLASGEQLVFSPVDYAKGDVKSQIAAVIRYLPEYYHFQNLGGYNALLSLFNITAEVIKKDYNGEIKEGLMYFALNADGNKVCNPFKASLFGKQAGLTALRSHFEKSGNVTPETKTKTSQIISQALNLTTNERDFKNYLISHGINTVLRRNEQGRLYGITFIDHNTRQVLNGSHLGKQYSANVFHELFSDKNNNENRNIEPKVPENNDLSNTIPIKEELHPFFEFLMNAGNIIGHWDILNSLLLNGLAEDPEEQMFEFNMKKKKKRGQNRN